MIYGMWAYLSTFSRFGAFIWKLGSGSGSASKWMVVSGFGSASKWQAGSGSASASSRCGSATLVGLFNLFFSQQSDAAQDCTKKFAIRQCGDPWDFGADPDPRIRTSDRWIRIRIWLRIRIQLQIRLPSSLILRMQKKISYFFLITSPQAHHLQSKKYNFLLKFCRHYISPLNTFIRKGKYPDPQHCFPLSFLWLHSLCYPCFSHLNLPLNYVLDFLISLPWLLLLIAYCCGMISMCKFVAC